ncbi:MAG: hypothetical protein WA634_01450, partial [Silvibacterium sp.]
ISSAVLAAATLCATSAFAANKAVVNIPFNFVSQGHSFPAGQYVATVDTNHNVLALSSTTNTKVSAHWVAGPAGDNPNDEKLILKFDDLGNKHTLRTVQLGPEVTSRLDAPSRHHDAGSIAATVSGQ